MEEIKKRKRSHFVWWESTRIREETEFRPNPMVEIGHKPILGHIMKTYSYYGFNLAA
jgi:NDP-sugar pyrophosphorylase family protein